MWFEFEKNAYGVWNEGAYVKNEFLFLRRRGIHYLLNILYLLIWVSTGFVGAYQRFNSPIFDKWLEQNNAEIVNQGYEPNFFEFLGYTPLIVLIIESIIAVFCIGVYGFFYLLLTRQFPLRSKYAIMLLPASIALYSGYLACVGLLRNLKWEFYILVTQDVAWLTYVVFVILSYWKLIREYKM